MYASDWVFSGVHVREYMGMYGGIVKNSFLLAFHLR